MPFQDRARLTVEFDNGALDISGIDRRALDVGRLRDAPDRDDQALTTAGE